MKQVSGKDIYTPTEVNNIARVTLEQMILWVEGEISSCKKNPNWNFYYLDLKDDKAILPCIAEGSLFENFGEDPIGQKVLAYGNLTLYEPFGKYQLRIAQIEKAGEGIWQRQLEELIAKLKTEGLFDQKHKKPIPLYPKKVCLVTSVGSDAWQDFKTHTVDKFPIIQLYNADVRVQGPKSIAQLLKVLPAVDRKNFDVTVITRGGGSPEDLAAFNSEAVARVIFAMKTPTIVAIGHEANESLAEWVSDKRASTPTDAANVVTLGYNKVLDNLASFQYRLASKTEFYFSTNFQKLDYLAFRLGQTKIHLASLPYQINTLKESLKKHEKIVITGAGNKLNNLYVQLYKLATSHPKMHQIKLAQLQKALVLLSPENTLSRGYSITTSLQGDIIRSINSVVVGNKIGVKLADGRLASTVNSKIKNG